MPRLSSHFCLRQITHREDCLEKIVLVELIKKIRLILILVLGTQQFCITKLAARAGIVSGRDNIGTIVARPLCKRAKLDLAITGDIGIRRLAALIRFDHLLHDTLLVVGGQIYFLKCDAQRRRYAHSIEAVSLPGALYEFRLPYLDEYTHHGISRFFE